MIVGVDASNLRWGGGRTHLIEMLSAVESLPHPIRQIVVWGAPATLSLLPDRPWLRKSPQAALERGLLARTWWQMRDLPELTRRVDLVFSPGGLRPRTERPVVVMCQNMLLFELEQRRKFGTSMTRARLEALRVAHRGSYRRSAGVIFLSTYSADVVRRDLGPGLPRSTVISHGVSPSFFISPRRARTVGELTREQPFRVVYVSSVSAYKNQDALVEGVAAVARRYPVELVLLGPAESSHARDHLERVIESSHAREFVRWQGDVPYGEVRSYLESSDLCVYPSSCESFGIAVLEAMAAGLPIAASGSGSLPEVLGDAGCRVDGENPRDIAATVQRLLEEPIRRTELAHRAYERARTFTWQRCAEETLRFLASTRCSAPGSGQESAAD